MPLFQMQIDTTHPVLFISDGINPIVAPEDVGKSFVTMTDSCICFWVLSHVDGASLITVTDRACRNDGIKLFEGSVDVPSGTLSICDSNSFRYLNVPVTKGRVPIVLWANDKLNPDWVWIKSDAIKSI